VHLVTAPLAERRALDIRTLRHIESAGVTTVETKHAHVRGQEERHERRYDRLISQQSRIDCQYSNNRAASNSQRFSTSVPRCCSSCDLDRQKKWQKLQP